MLNSFIITWHLITLIHATTMYVEMENKIQNQHQTNQNYFVMQRSHEELNEIKISTILQSTVLHMSQL